jgi:hypothetical protein
MVQEIKLIQINFGLLSWVENVAIIIYFVSIVEVSMVRMTKLVRGAWRLW